MSLIEKHGSLQKVIAQQTGIAGISLDHPWGSCQYATAYAMFKMLKDLEDPDDSSRNYWKFNDLINLAITHNQPLEETEVMTQIRQKFHDRFKSWPDDEWTREKISKIDDLKTVSEAINFCQNTAWDLWTAADFLSKLVFPNLKIEIQKSPGSGPVLNQIVQSGNNITGTQCWLLHHYGYITDIEDFAHFDT